MTDPGNGADRHPAVSAVMPVLDDVDHLGAAVESVLAQTHPGSLEVVIGLGPSTDGTDRVAAELAAVHPEVSVVDNPDGGTAAGLNAAIAASKGAVIVRVDAHCVLPEGYIARAVATMARTGAANVGGVQHAVGTTPFQRAVASAMTSRFGVGDSKFHFGGPEGETDTVYLGVFDASALAEVGGFDESLVRNQDYELNVRLRAAGHVVWFDPDLVVTYHPRSTASRLARQYFEYGRWKREVVHRHPGSVKARQLVAPATVVGLAAGTTLGLCGRRVGWVAPAVYGLAVAGASAIAPGANPAERTRLMGVFPTMHLSWGVGFLLGPPRSAGRATTPDASAARLTAS